MHVKVQPIYLEHPQKRLIRQAVDILLDGGIVVYPTDTIYGLGIDLFHKKAIERVLRIKKESRHKMLSFILPDLKQIAEWAIVPDYAYRIMRRVVPGPYTFILRATKKVPKLLLSNQKTVGIRIPDSEVAIELVRELGRPILSTSVPQGNEGFYTDPQEIAERFKNEVDLILDAGVMPNKPSTVVDFSGNEPVILREGAGDIEALKY
ncbi:threonylcarbamoyl-AMP synthase [candidate division KSB1 bacterium]|nr:MAG: threonylcarbamoyl-AMP synthase [candidate division KSB1 bacterium]